MKSKKWYVYLPVLGEVFCIWYVRYSFVDVVYSDYIRLVNSYLPDVWNPKLFFVGDILTRIPLNFVARIVNVTFFGYQIAFDQTLGIISLGLGASLVADYCIKRDIGPVWLMCLMAVMFSLNKWEILINGSSWIHCLAFAAFFWHYLVFERVWAGEEKEGDRVRLSVSPWLITLLVAGPYCASYTAVLLLAYGFRLLLVKKKEKRWEKICFLYGLCAVIPVLLYLWSSSYVTDVIDGQGREAGMTFVAQLLDTPGFMVRFLLKSCSSAVIGLECAQAAFQTNLPYMALGLAVAAAYLLALWFQYSRKLYEETIFPLMLIVSGGINHILILLSRWIFLKEDYGMSSRYALQFQVGILGILITFALTWKRKEGSARGGGGDWKRIGSRAAMASFLVVLLAGNGYTTKQELKKMPDRKAACAARAEIALDFENRTDDELRAAFEYRMGNPMGGRWVREALEILKENHLNIFRQ